MSTARIYSFMSAASEFFAIKIAELQWATRNSAEKYQYVLGLIEEGRNNDALTKLQYFLEQGFNPNCLPEDINGENSQYNYLLYRVMAQSYFNPIKVKSTLLLLNAGAELSLVANENGHPNMMQILFPQNYSTAYAKLLVSHGLYLPAVDAFPCQNATEILKIAQDEPDFVNVYHYMTSAENALNEDPPNYKDAIENYEQAKQCFERIAESEAGHADDSEIYGYDELIVDHYRQRALDCQEEIVRCEADLRDSDEDTAPLEVEETEGLLVAQSNRS